MNEAKKYGACDCCKTPPLPQFVYASAQVALTGGLHNPPDCDGARCPNPYVFSPGIFSDPSGFYGVTLEQAQRHIRLYGTPTVFDENECQCDTSAGQQLYNISKTVAGFKKEAINSSGFAGYQVCQPAYPSDIDSCPPSSGGTTTTTITIQEGCPDELEISYVAPGCTSDCGYLGPNHNKTSPPYEVVDCRKLVCVEHRTSETVEAQDELFSYSGGVEDYISCPKITVSESQVECTYKMVDYCSPCGEFDIYTLRHTLSEPVTHAELDSISENALSNAEYPPKCLMPLEDFYPLGFAYGLQWTRPNWGDLSLPPPPYDNINKEGVLSIDYSLHTYKRKIYNNYHYEFSLLSYCPEISLPFNPELTSTRTIFGPKKKYILYTTASVTCYIRIWVSTFEFGVKHFADGSPNEIFGVTPIEENDYVVEFPEVEDGLCFSGAKRMAGKCVCDDLGSKNIFEIIPDIELNPVDISFNEDFSSDAYLPDGSMVLESVTKYRVAQISRVSLMPDWEPPVYQFKTVHLDEAVGFWTGRGGQLYWVPWRAAFPLSEKDKENLDLFFEQVIDVDESP